MRWFTSLFKFFKLFFINYLVKKHSVPLRVQVGFLCIDIIDISIVSVQGVYWFVSNYVMSSLKPIVLIKCFNFKFFHIPFFFSLFWSKPELIAND